MTADARLEGLIRGTLSADLDGARGGYPAWPGSPAHRRTVTRHERPAMPRRWATAVLAAFMVALAIGVATRPVGLPAVGPGTSPDLGTQTGVTVIGQGFDPDTSSTGPVVLLVPGPWRDRIWMLADDGYLRPGPWTAGVSIGEDRHWATDGETVAQITDIEQSDTDRSAGERPALVTVARLDASSDWASLYLGDVGVGTASWVRTGIEAIPGGGYLLTRTDRVVTIHDGEPVDRGEVPDEFVTRGATNHPARYLIGPVDRRWTSETPRPRRWVEMGTASMLEMPTTVFGVSPAVRSAGLAWVEREGAGWSAVQSDGRFLPTVVPAAGMTRDDSSYAIDPTGRWVVSTPRAGVIGRTRLFDASTGEAVASVAGQPVGRVAWLGDAAVFAVQVPGEGGSEDAEPVDGGLVRLSPTGAGHLVWDRSVSDGPVRSYWVGTDDDHGIVCTPDGRYTVGTGNGEDVKVVGREPAP